MITEHRTEVHFTYAECAEILRQHANGLEDATVEAKYSEKTGCLVRLCVTQPVSVPQPQPLPCAPIPQTQSEPTA